MKLLVGLGNPGPQYETTRHNAGFLILDLIAEQFGLRWEGNKFGGEFCKGSVGGESCLLLKPLTFMNLSGKSVAACAGFYKLQAPDIVVLHDEIDVPAGKVKAKVGGGAGGHNGIRSIQAETGMDGFHRLKLGVGKPEGATAASRQSVHDWVLGRMTDEELKALQGPMFQEVLVRLKGIFQQHRTNE